HDLPFACLRLLHFCEILSGPGIRGLRSGIVRFVWGKHLQNPASRPSQKLQYAVQLEHRPGREIREFLVVRRLECERSFAGNERTSARDGTAIEIEAKHEQAAAAKGGSHDLREITATAL